jgi:hypothetical protein
MHGAGFGWRWTVIASVFNAFSAGIENKLEIDFILSVMPPRGMTRGVFKIIP